MGNLSSSTPWQDGLKMASFCPLCETRFQPTEARPLGEDGDTRLFHVRCRKCGNSILALVLVNPGGVSSVGLVTDLTFDDVMRFRKEKPLGPDDVLKTHEWLSGRSWGKSLAATRQRTRTRAKKPKTTER